MGCGGAAVTGTQLANADVTLNNATLQFASVFASTQNGSNQLKSVSGAGTVSLGGSALIVGLNNGSGAFSGSVTGTGSITSLGNITNNSSNLQTISAPVIMKNGIAINGKLWVWVIICWGDRPNNRFVILAKRPGAIRACWAREIAVSDSP